MFKLYVVKFLLSWNEDAKLGFENFLCLCSRVL
uniref:Sec14 cytosolic factor n=1 Tax=Rhizophora mucronata TaxID=61149 RepID=A0A2P2JJ94_RHIMU